MSLLALTIPDISGGGQTINAPTGIPQPEPGMMSKIIGNGINIFIIIAIVLCIISVVWAGIQWTSSSGNKEKIASARARLTWSLIGLIIVLTSFFIVKIVGGIFNVNLI